MSIPRHVLATQYTDVEAVIQFVDRGLLVVYGNDDFVVREVRITYRWLEVEQKWSVKEIVGAGRRKMPGTGYEGVVVKEVKGHHPDYAELARENQPRWKPPKFQRSV